ncbi:hypothetical protein PYJP_03200 [Pyrofollis japonicus]|nr:hypothetical protein PYJP_03200 [Pyrofollis japonicus]
MIIKHGSALNLPYETRDPNSFQKLVAKLLYVVKCNEKIYKILFFKTKGLREKVYACKGVNIRVFFKQIRVRDHLSDLELRLQQPVLAIDQCKVPLAWKKSRFILSVQDVEACEKCSPI